MMDDHSEAYAILDRAYESLDKLQSSQSSLKSQQELYGMEILDTSVLRRHKTTLINFKQLWDIAALIVDEVDQRANITWSQLTDDRLDVINTELTRSTGMLEELPAVVARTPVYFNLHDQCTKLQQMLPLVSDLHDPAMRPPSFLLPGVQQGRIRSPTREAPPVDGGGDPGAGCFSDFD